ncbi:MAG: RnfABCDGE type electron transport complex subunit B [Clostridia bacterium]|nr:RnfABCDGE type electron transport complex subunit B [Clostridia bacterium]
MTELLNVFIVVTLIGIAAGVLLAVASYFLRVEENEQVKKVRECLPGVNCGACGFTGCDEYAKAIVEENAKTNLCIPGADETAKEISALLGTEFEDVVEMVAYVKCNGKCASKQFIYDGIDKCSAAKMVYGGEKRCKFACLGCGDCAKICPQNAIFMCDNVAKVDPSLCIGCGMCVKECPNGIIELIPQISKVKVLCSNTLSGAITRKMCVDGCIGCRKCEKNCPENAIKVENNLAKIDYDLCTGCGKCAEVCPVHCISAGR